MPDFSQYFRRREVWIFAILILLAATFRISVAHHWPNDAPDDSKTYARIARNLLEQHSYSDAEAPPYEPTLIRLPGYPLFLAAIYKVFGHGNNGAVRIVQALIDTATCGLIALLAYQWQPDGRRKLVTAIAALALATVCPFTTIYAATILTEVPTMLLALATCVTATIALRADDRGRRLRWWCISGLLAGLGTMFRPDSGLFFAAIGLTLVIMALVRIRARGRRAILSAATFSVAFILVLTPWTIRNARVFHLFQPLVPTHAEMPGEFVPRGYIRWLKTWIDDQQYIDAFWWELNVQPMSADDLPDDAFDSDAERDRVAALFDKYNHAAQAADVSAASESRPSPTPDASPNPTPAKPKSAATIATPNPKSESPKNANSDAGEEGSNGDENDQDDQSGDQADENDNSDAEQSNQSKTAAPASVEMTPEIDAAFGEIANERIARHPLRYYIWTPAKRAYALWFNTHSDYYPFEGALLPLSDLDYQAHQHIWLSLFAALVGLYTILGLGGLAVLWTTEDFYARSWALLATLIIVTRFALFSSVESPEPRYMVELFPFLAALGGIAIARVFKRVT